MRSRFLSGVAVLVMSVGLTACGNKMPVTEATEGTYLDSVPVAGALDIASILSEKEPEGAEDSIQEADYPDEFGSIDIDIYGEGDTIYHNKGAKSIDITAFTVLYLNNVSDHDVIFRVYGEGLNYPYDSSVVEPNGSEMYNTRLYMEETDCSAVIEQWDTKGTLEAVRIVRLHKV